jgi:formylglycine-generating enzyme required for sulfatase activity
MNSSALLLLSRLLLLAFLIAAGAASLRAAERVALVVGNGAYKHGVPLGNPANDAREVSAALKAAGFEVTLAVDTGLAALEQKVVEFRQAAQGAKAAWFYYAGHGVEVKGANYLVPVDAEVKEEFQVRHKTLALDQVLGALDEAGTPLKVVVLDCCRDNPFGRSWSRSAVGGLAQVGSTPEGTIIAYAAAPGKTASDGHGTNSPYTLALVEALTKPGLEVDQVFKETGRLVLAATNRTQQPWVNSSFYDHFVVVPGSTGGGMTSPMVSPIVQPATTSGSILDQGAVGKAIQVKLPGEVVMKFGFCPAGSFMMGSPQSEKERSDDEDQVQVRITKSFWMGQTEVTQGQWAALMGTTPEQQKAKGDSFGDVNGVGADHPMYFVSWEDAQTFITKLNQSVPLPSGWKYALPTEAQWEYACRAETESVFSFGSVLNGKEANCNGNYPYGTTQTGPYLEKTAKVGSYAPNACGLYDMHGNVYEWCQDAWDGSSKLPGGTDPLGTVGSFRVIRGGSWYDDALRCRAADRLRYTPGYRRYDLGFRVAAVPAGAR